MTRTKTLREWGLTDAKFTEIEVEISTLDELIPVEIDVALIKMDVEGSNCVFCKALGACY
jgi:hypothetical protein